MGASRQPARQPPNSPSKGFEGQEEPAAAGPAVARARVHHTARCKGWAPLVWKNAASCARGSGANECRGVLICCVFSRRTRRARRRVRLLLPGKAPKRFATGQLRLRAPGCHAGCPGSRAARAAVPPHRTGDYDPPARTTCVASHSSGWQSPMIVHRTPKRKTGTTCTTNSIRTRRASAASRQARKSRARLGRSPCSQADRAMPRGTPRAARSCKSRAAYRGQCLKGAR